MECIAIKYTNGTIIAREWEEDIVLIPETSSQALTVTVIDPFLIGDIPEKGDECEILTKEGNYSGKVFSHFTKNKVRFTKSDKIDLNKETWRRYQEE